MRSEIGVLYLSKFNEQVIRKILQENDLCFKELFTANPHVFYQQSIHWLIKIL